MANIVFVTETGNCRVTFNKMTKPSVGEEVVFQELASFFENKHFEVIKVMHYPQGGEDYKHYHPRKHQYIKVLLRPINIKGK